uniref:Uncharacterized protein n=1 Tax=Oryza meridionalis TaxID=40149 RepID=A0A0E0E589_9ORYZ
MAIQKTEEQYSAFFHLQRQALTQKQITERRRRRDSSPPLTSRDQVFDMRALVNCCHGADHKRASAARTRVPKPQHASTAAATATLAFLASAATEATTPRLTAPTNADVRKNVHTFSCALPTAPPSSPPNTASTAPNDTDATATAMAYILGLPVAAVDVLLLAYRRSAELDEHPRGGPGDHWEDDGRQEEPVKDCRGDQQQRRHQHREHDNVGDG